jgi:hypothetical protein
VTMGVFVLGLNVSRPPVGDTGTRSGYGCWPTSILSTTATTFFGDGFVAQNITMMPEQATRPASSGNPPRRAYRSDGGAGFPRSTGTYFSVSPPPPDGALLVVRR